ncbi:MAG: type II secretion system protein [Actinobacteria bacterium]|nr:type II secretion system protein [Actinomycetota bacterium]
MARKASRTGSSSVFDTPRATGSRRLQTSPLHPAAGFTIVELLIVVVIIAILAATTLVAFNGITNRAKASAAATAAEQAAKKVAIYAVSNGETLPNALSDAGVSDANGTSYQYRTYDNGKSFCITATANSVSAFVNNVDQTSPKAGACDGHSPNGGTTITNIAVNPALRSGTAGWGVHFAASASFTTARIANGGPSGTPYYSTQFTSAPLSNNSISIGYGGIG